MIRVGFLFLCCVFATLGQAMEIKQKQIYGYVEKVALPELKASVKAKLDTGAKSSSLSAVNIQEVEEGEHTYLIFTVPLKSGAVTLKKPLVGEVKIKARSGETHPKNHKPKPLHRPIVKLTMKMGQQQKEIEVNLTNRKRFNYPLLLGREALVAFRCIVDPAEAFIAD